MGAIQAETPQLITAARPRSLSAAPQAPLSPRRVLVLRALKLGDLLCAIPALRALRAAWPAAEIVLLGLPWARVLVDRYPEYLDGFREFPGYPGLPEQPPDARRLESVRAELRREKFDLAIQMHGDGSIVNGLVASLGADRSAGFYPGAGPCPDPQTYLAWPTRGLEVHRLLALCALLGAPRSGDELEWKVTPADRRGLACLVAPRQLTVGQYACVHPGASTPERRWPLDCFAELATDLAGRGYTIVLTGAENERDLAAALRDRVAGGVLDLSGRTDLGALGALIAGARVVVCNDTGVSHLAAAVRTPSVVLSTGVNPERWAPVDSARHRVLRREDGGGTSAALREVHDLLAAPQSEPVRSPRRQRHARRLECSRSGC